MNEVPAVNITNFFTTVNITFLAVGGVVGSVLTIVTKFGSKFIDEYFNNRAEKNKKKRKLARDIIGICTEGSSVGYNAMPGSRRHIQFVASREDVVETFGDKFDETLAEFETLVKV